MELPTLHTERLTLGPVELEEADRVSELAGEEAIARNTESIPHPYPEGEAGRVIGKIREDVEAGRAAVFAVRLAEDGAGERRLIGMMGLHPEPEHERAGMGYWIGRPYWGRGYATEAGREVLRWGFEEAELRRIYAESFARNRASCRVLEKLGMQREGRLRQHFKKWDEFVDVEIYGLLREEWEASQ